MDRRHSLPVAWKEIGPAWNRLLTLMRRDFGRITFVRVVEPQPKSGYPHYHVLLSNYIPMAWLSAHVERCGFGRVFDVQGIKGNQARHYIGKYLRKPWPVGDGTDYAIIAGIRRISGSRGFTISIRSDNCWAVIDNDFLDGSINRLGWWFQCALPPELYRMVHTSSSDDWVCVEAVPDIIPEVKTLIEAGFEPFGFMPGAPGYSEN